MDRLKRTRASVVFFALFMFCTGASAAAETSGSSSGFGSVGLQVVPTVDGNLVVLRVVTGTSADKHAMRPGDLVFQVDDFRLAGSDFGKVVSEHLWGPPGTEVTLHFLRPGEPGERVVTLERSAPLDPQLTVSPALKDP